MTQALPLLLLLFGCCCCFTVYGQGQASLSVEQQLELVKRQLLIPGYPAIGKRSPVAASLEAEEAVAAEEPATGGIGGIGGSGGRCGVTRREFQQLRRTVVSIYLRMLESELRSRGRQPQPPQPPQPQPPRQPQHLTGYPLE